MITFIRTSGKMPNCGRCKTPMPYWDLRNDESTYRCDSCHDIELGEFWDKAVKNMFAKAKEKIEHKN